MALPIHAASVDGWRATRMALFKRKSALRHSYDAVTEEYASRIYGELDDKPADRRLLDHFADAVKESGACVELGCGPGQITRYLHERGLDISGIDLSGKMVKKARKLNPGISFSRGDMRRLSVDDNHWAAIVALYSLIHIPPQELEATLLEFHRTIEPGGALLIAFHIGNQKEHLDEWWGQAVDLDFYFYRTLDMVIHLQQAGFEQVSTYTRQPYPEIESQTRRCYILAEALPGIPPARRTVAATAGH
jgi:SAM-dependent methyltransferase